MSTSRGRVGTRQRHRHFQHMDQHAHGNRRRSAHAHGQYNRRGIARQASMLIGDPALEEVEQRAQRNTQWISDAAIVVTIIGLIATAALFTAIFYHRHDTANLDGRNVTLENATCTDPLDDACIPPDLILDTVKVNDEANFMGDVLCSNPIWPSCLDISGQNCMTPLDHTCVPTAYDELLVNTLVLNDTLTCAPNATIETGCIAALPSANLACDEELASTCLPTSYDTLSVDTLNVNTSLLNGPLTCTDTGSIQGECVDAIQSSQLVCDQPFDCLPPNATFDSLVVENLTVTNMTQIDLERQDMLQVDNLTVNNTLLTGPLTCSEHGSISGECVDAIQSSQLICDQSFDCLPPDASFGNLTVDFLIINNDTNIMLPNMLELESLVVNTTTITGPLTCTGTGGIDGTCIDTIDGDQITCINELSETCFPNTWDTLNVTGTLTVNATTTTHLTVNENLTVNEDLTVNGITTLANTTLTGALTCNGEGSIDGTCVNQIASSQLVCDQPFDCLPANATFDSLVVDNLVVNNMTMIDIEYQEMLEVNHLVVNQTTLNGALTCEGDGSIDPDCMDISNKACPGGDLDASCIPDIPASTVICDAALPDACVDISMKSCTSPINANCVDISGETCMSPISASCLPTIDGVSFSAGPSPTIDLIEGTGVTITPNPGANSITIAASVNNTIPCDDPALNLDCLSDVTIDATPTDGDVLKYNGTSGQWEPVSSNTGCPNLRIVSGRFLNDGTESPASPDYSVVKQNMKEYIITYTVPFITTPFVTITAEESSGMSTRYASIVTGQNTATAVEIRASSSSTDAFNFQAMIC